ACYAPLVTLARVREVLARPDRRGSASSRPAARSWRRPSLVAEIRDLPVWRRRSRLVLVVQPGPLPDPKEAAYTPVGDERRLDPAAGELLNHRARHAGAPGGREFRRSALRAARATGRAARALLPEHGTTETHHEQACQQQI